MAITLSDIRDALAGLNGETSTPVDASRDRQIQRTIEDIWYRYPWTWREETLSTLFDGNGHYTAPSDFNLYSFPQGGNLNTNTYSIKDSSGTEYTLIDVRQSDNYDTGDTVLWVTGNEVDGYVWNVPTADITLSITYFVKHDVLTSAPSQTRIPVVNPIAYGAYARLQKPQDIDRNNSLEQRDYEAEIAKLWSMENMNVSGRIISPNERAGTFIGDVR